MLCLDRSQWQIGQTPVHVLMLAVAYKGIAIPLLGRVMAKKGNSNTEERIVLLERVLKRFGRQAIAYLTADREFRGREWLAYLKRSHLPFRLRIPNNTPVSNRHRNQRLAVTRLFPLKVGEVRVLKRARTIWGTSVYLGAVRTANGHAIIIADTYTLNGVAQYTRRWEIET